MIFRILILIIFSAGYILPQHKSSFDIHTSGLNKNNTGAELISANDHTQITISEEGYFTAGTSKGVSALNSDDKCQITYGHPYALTSYPLIALDGRWYRTGAQFNKNNEMIMRKRGDTLELSCSNGVISYEFLIINIPGGTIQFIQRIINNDTVAHKAGTGIIIDPALGKWGDGRLFAGEIPLRRDTLLKVDSNTPGISVWEKHTGAKGMGFNLSSDISFSLYADNWNSGQEKNSPGSLSHGSPGELYDLLLRIFFDEIQIEAGSELLQSLSLTLMSDFSTDLFTRWDLPNCLDITDGMMFPRELDTYAEISDLTGSAVSCTIEPVFESNLKCSVQQFTTSLDVNGTFQKIRLSSDISYEDKIVEAILKIRMNDSLVDEIRRYVFIPKTPVSDSGLTVSVDSVITSSPPAVDFVFHVTDDKTGRILGDIKKENIFLYENSSRINYFSLNHDTSGGSNAADIVFALDVTGSMGNVIDQVKNNIVEFADSLKARGIDYRLGLVTFLDVIENTYDFTTDVNVFKNWISQQYAHGGDDAPENSLQALKTSSEFSFRTNCSRTIVWITDIDYHEKDWATPLNKQQVIDQLLLNDITVHSIGNEGYKSSSYDPIIIPTNGKFYNIYGNFRDILLDISRMRAAGKFVISYNSSSPGSPNEVKLEIRYGGLGGSATFQYSRTGKQSKDKAHLSFYPNPFNPDITFDVNTSGYTEGSISIFNILGQCVKSFTISNTNSSRLIWNARNDLGSPVTTGFYIVQLVLSNQLKEVYKETAKILYMR